MTVIERETETRTATDAVFERAADLLGEFGWCQHELGSKEVGYFCMVGAICAALDERAFYATRPLNAILEKAGVDDIADWNDAPGRTKAEVVAKLREAARIARQTEANA